jgi:hypothetical protein
MAGGSSSHLRARRRAVGPNGEPPGRTTEGVIRPLPTIASRARIIGKESRHLGIGRGVHEAPEYSEYGGDDDLPEVIEAARRLSKDWAVREGIREAVGIGERELANWLSGSRRPRSETRGALIAAVARAAKRELLRLEPFGTWPRDDLTLIAAFLDTPEPERRYTLCGRPLAGRQRQWCSETCRKRSRVANSFPCSRLRGSEDRKSASSALAFPLTPPCHSAVLPYWARSNRTGRGTSASSQAPAPRSN